MARIVVMGAGICGLAGAMMLSRDGHEVTVLERDPAPVPASPEEAWEDWDRDGVTQFRQPHWLLPSGRAVLEEELPDVYEALLAEALSFSPLDLLPPWIADRAPRDGDDRFMTITGRRTTLEQVVARAAENEPHLEVRRGTAVGDVLTTQIDGHVHVTGVHTADGEDLRADLVVDAMGRRSPVPQWLAAAGAPPVHDEAEDIGFIYYTRFFRGEQLPQACGSLLTPIGSFSVLTLPADKTTWSITVLIAGGDRPLKRLRDADRWTAVLAACPMQARWLEGQPITGIRSMGGIVDRYRRLMAGGQPVATGLALVADACASTNPSVGRGIALGLLHARRLRDVVREQLDDPRSFALAWNAATDAELTPWYRATVQQDRTRMHQIEAIRNGLAPPPPVDADAAILAALPLAAIQDADMFRVMLDLRSCIGSPTAVLERPGLAKRVLELAAASAPPPLAGPNREELLALLA
ncbi:MAG TPA: NAD-binding protein [Solirubrobacteraceae bacterium]|nr:NAD-binding protein [Solirubrobacteraceae bacterium]